jgi:hypothetical protein
LPLIRNRNFAIASIIVVLIVVIFIAVIISTTTPFPITIPLRTSLTFHLQKPIKDRNFAVAASQKPRNRKNPKEKTKTRVCPKKSIWYLYYTFSLSISIESKFRDNQAIEKHKNFVRSKSKYTDE